MQSKTPFERFSDIILKSPIGAAFEKRRQLIEETDPNRIYVENVSSFFSIPYKAAKYFCDVAVREGLFEKRIGYLCPNDGCHSLLADFAPGEEPDPLLFCENCEALNQDQYRFSPEECRTLEFYRLINQE